MVDKHTPNRAHSYALGITEAKPIDGFKVQFIWRHDHDQALLKIARRRKLGHILIANQIMAPPVFQAPHKVPVILDSPTRPL